MKLRESPSTVTERGKAFRLLRALAVTVVLASAFVTTAAAPAAAVPSSPGYIYYGSDNWCHFENWGGNFYCEPHVRTAVVWPKPDGHYQVFVLGMEAALWTRWANAQGVYDWLYFGGHCRPANGLDARSNGWSIIVACVGTDNAWWHRTRNSNGSWTGWIKGKGF
jgi:hypothetical protein